MITCVITHGIDPKRHTLFAQHARAWGKCSLRCGSDPIGHFAPQDGSTSTAYGICSLPSLAEYETYRTRLAADPPWRENSAFTRRERFPEHNCIFVKLASALHGLRA